MKFRIEKTLVMNDLYRGLESVFYLAARREREGRLHWAAAKPAWLGEKRSNFAAFAILRFLCPVSDIVQ